MSGQRFNKIFFQSILLAVIVAAMTGCTSSPEPAWQKLNQELISEHNLKVRNLSGLPANNIESNLKDGQVTSLDQVDSIDLAPGVVAKIFWGTGTMVSVIELAPNAKIPEVELPAERFAFVLEGSIDQLINGKSVTLVSKEREAPDGTHSGTPRVDFVYLEKGSKSAVTAGSAGAKLLEIYSPFRLDYLEKAGVTNLPTTMAELTNQAKPNVKPNQVYDLYDFQLTELAPGAFSRLIAGKNTQFSFISMEPGSVFGHHIHPEEQMMMALRGECDEILLDTEQRMTPGDVVVIPGNMVHGAKMSAVGCDALDIFWPVRADYMEKEQARMAAYRAIIPENAKPELLVDGTKTKPSLTFSEGPKWMNGKVYFSNMYFDQSWTADPSKSSTIELSPDGTYKNITQGKMQTNGLYPYKNGNLLVCDMIGHRVVEMTPAGKVVKVIVDQYDGKPIDGPNDIITDAKGGIYFTDPQFTMEPKKAQPGRAVYYVSPEGKVTRLTEPNEFAMPNGIVLSPDGKTLYINNCYDDESWFPVNSEKDNYIWAYDVKEDGTISNGRQFAKLFLTGNVLDRKGKSSSADGMAIDKKGNLYVATYYGVQIFNAEGKYVGMINLPSFPVSLCFGGKDMKTLYIVSYSKVYTIRTNMEGFVNYL
ncbi:MAG TPA: SMP-30/gluconolactonase/LRE family protein [Haliscomenobacter sp.]|uniref:SMP-30/gluconolactonase/LRE family protein n=1 Tax=Haliscomenobacter sp. TaxID=2717303 RepID=UPI002BFF918D|nr:SMP-30/gluconolactonase/LRE family protein [Haliscomenobacter sp.]HOY19515.1 SMP-30/gluconolactonase/LRE family protein [Haliscomenobacter sp.]HPH18060.1 SMP-30/gluconolactonase/LRE family protein [Haliscomenobacter sp.]